MKNFISQIFASQKFLFFIFKVLRALSKYVDMLELCKVLIFVTKKTPFQGKQNFPSKKGIVSLKFKITKPKKGKYGSK
jgi:hypothetical protein